MTVFAAPESGQPNLNLMHTLRAQLSVTAVTLPRAFVAERVVPTLARLQRDFLVCPVTSCAVRHGMLWWMPYKGNLKSRPAVVWMPFGIFTGPADVHAAIAALGAVVFAKSSVTVAELDAFRAVEFVFAWGTQKHVSEVFVGNPAAFSTFQ